MADAPLSIWCNLRLDDDAQKLLSDGVAPHLIVGATLNPNGNSPLGRPDPRLAEGDLDLAFGQPEAEQCAGLGRLRWIHLSSAGYTSFDRPKIHAALAGRGTALTTSSGVYNEPCAQHALAFLLAHARQLPRSIAHQLGDRAWATKPTRAASRLLGEGQTVLLVGFGAIARRLAELLLPFRMNLIGVRRRPSPSGEELIAMIARDALDAHLPGADYVINVLPANADSAGFFDARRFGLMKAGAVFINIGRGTTVDQDALLGALRAGPLAAAYLDVTEPEPLPPEHALWSTPNCVITPHAAGGHHDEQIRLVRHFVANLRRYERGEPLFDRVI